MTINTRGCCVALLVQYECEAIWGQVAVTAEKQLANQDSTISVQTRMPPNHARTILLVRL